MYYIKGQKHYLDCGRASVATILGLYGIDYNYKNLNDLPNLLDMLVCLNSYGVKCEAYECFIINEFPLIAQVKKFNRYHFIVIYEENDDKFLYYSPNKLMVHKISKNKFYKIYTGKCLIILDKKPYNNYKIDLKSFPFAIKLIFIDLFLIFLIISLLMM